MYLIVVGAGGIGRPLIDIATNAGHEVVVIELSEERANAVAEEHDCLVIEADATSKETLVEAGADEADAVIATTDHDPTNIMVCLLAKELEIPRLVSVVHREDDIGVFRQIGVHALEHPERVIAESLFRTVSVPSVQDHMRVGDGAEIYEIEVPSGAPIVGRTLREADEDGLIPDDLLVVAIERDGEGSPAIPRGGTRIESGDRVLVYSPADRDMDDLQAFEEEPSA